MTVPLAVKDLCKCYQVPKGEPFCAVKGISFEIDAGECFGLLGPNGAGKSTSMNCIVGFYPPTSGSVRILDIDVHSDPKTARAYLGVCSQDDTLDTDFTVFDQMVRYATFFRIPKSIGKERAKRLLETFQLEGKSEVPVEELSGGMRRRLQVARSLISEPKLLVLDEPTTGLDPEARRIVWGIISDFRSRGGAVLISTHYMEEAERLCDRIAILHRGQILDCAPPRKLIADHVGTAFIHDEIRPGVFWDRPPNIEDVYLKLTGVSLEEGQEEGE